jgi:protein involved in polysaccharide export with SLBB domain
MIAVAGQVNRSGAYELRDGMRVFDALNMAGGFRPYADRSHITLVRGKKRDHFDYDAYQRGEKTEDNIHLEVDDAVVVK